MEEVAYKAQKARYTKETVLFRQGDTTPHIYFIHTGYVLIHKVDVNGNSGILDLYGPGSWFGPGLSGQTQDIEAIAKSGCELEIAPIEYLDTMMNAISQTAQDLIVQLATRESQIQQRLFLHITAPLPVRLANLLIQLFHYQGQSCGHGHELDVKLSQAELAAMVGGSRQTVSQLLSRWKLNGVIDYTRQYICLINKPNLEALARN
ncbi:Crp/Fnr family transcriptional regulator [Microbulbifer epialgicus]|uniref:Crp/Fnr family transcriptional regulator n=1 Tax=Microbulbifer epialgicus TaxID=393907 RepID=A0ABV4P523_9GAMM